MTEPTQAPAEATAPEAAAEPTEAPKKTTRRRATSPAGSTTKRTSRAKATAATEPATTDAEPVADAATETEAPQTEAPAAKARATRKRTTKKVEPVAETAADATDSAQVDTAEAPSEPAAKKPTRRRSTKKTAEPAEADQSTEAAQDTPVAPEEQAEEPAAKKSARKRTTRKKAEAAPEADASEAAAEPAATQEAPESADADEAPKKPARKRATRKKAAPEQEQATAEATPAVAEDTAKTAEEPTEKPDAAQASVASPFGVPAGDFGLLFQAPDLSVVAPAKEAAKGDTDEQDADSGEDNQARSEGSSRRRRRRRRGSEDLEIEGGSESDPPGTITRVRAPRSGSDKGNDKPIDHVVAVKGSTRLEAKRQRRRESRESGRRRHGISEAEFLARRESVDRTMVVRQKDERIQIGVMEDGVLAEHFVSHTQQDSMIGNVYVGRVQNVLPSMEAAFVDIGRGRNAVLYAGEVDWNAAKLDGKPRRIENALKSGDSVLVQVTKDPVGHKGARLTSQISLPGRYLVYVPGGSMTGISRKLPDVERHRLKKILKDHLPDKAGVIVRTAAEGASEQELMNDINRLRVQWETIESAAHSTKTRAPELLYQEPDLMIKVVRDVFNEDFSELVVQGEHAWDTIEAYVTYVAPDLVGRLRQWTGEEDLFSHLRVDEQIRKALDRKVNLPSGGSLVIDRTEAMTVIDVNTGKFTGSGGNLEETVTKNNLEAAEEIVRQMRLRDMGGIIVVDFIDMVLESNRDLVLRRLVECLGRDRTKHQVAEVTSLGLVQMTRKKIGTGLLEVFSEPCEHCAGRGVVIHDEPVEGHSRPQHVHQANDRPTRSERRARKAPQPEPAPAAAEPSPEEAERAKKARAALASIAAASGHAGEVAAPDGEEHGQDGAEASSQGQDTSVPDDAGERPRRKRRRGRRGRGGRGQDENRQDGENGQDGAGQHEPAEVPAAETPREQPGQAAQSTQATQPAQPVQAAQAEASGPAKPRRRRRAAASAQGSNETVAVQAGEATGHRVSSAAAASAPAARAAAAEEPVMLGVGVPASEL